MEPFATITDLEAEWRPLKDDEVGIAERRLATSSLLIRRIKPGIDDEAATDEVLQEVLTFVVCDMVKNSMNTAERPHGVAQITDTRGPFSSTMQFSNPDENLFFKKMHRRLLGLDDESFTVDLLGSHPKREGLIPVKDEIWP